MGLKDTLYRDKTMEELVLLLHEKDQALIEKNHVIAEKDKRLEDIKLHYAWLLNQVFGSKSEKKAYWRNRQIVDESQPMLFDFQEPLDAPKEPPEKNCTVAQYERKHRKKRVDDPKKKGSHLKFSDNVPKVVIEIENPLLKEYSPEELIEVGTTKTYRLAQSISPYYIKEYIRKSYKVRGQEETIVKAPVPHSVIPRSFADSSFLAGMVVEKCLYHMPIYRQHKKLLDSGIKISRSTMNRLFTRTAEILEPIHLAIVSSVLKSNVLHIDESPTPVLTRDGQTYFWAFLNGNKEVFFTYSPTRSTEVLEEYLKDFSGTIICDGYSAYESYSKERENKIELANCWVHARRKFYNAISLEPKSCDLVLNKIIDLYQAEREIKADPSRTLEIRMTKSKEIVDEIFDFISEQYKMKDQPGNNLYYEAIKYCLDREENLRRFLHDPNIAIDNNPIERVFRGPALGRKNWLFSQKDDGARNLAILYTISHSCLLAGLSPEGYFNDLLQKVDVVKAVDVGTLTPRNWKKLYGS